jgi:hypothetical protein
MEARMQGELAMEARTFFRRHICSELVSIGGLSGHSAVQVLSGNLEEIGEQSALILTEASVTRGTKVRVKGESHEMKGCVRSCTFDPPLGFFIEIELYTESRWLEKSFVPEHLFELRPSTYREPRVRKGLHLATSEGHSAQPCGETATPASGRWPPQPTRAPDKQPPELDVLGARRLARALLEAPHDGRQAIGACMCDRRSVRVRRESVRTVARGGRTSLGGHNGLGDSVTSCSQRIAKYEQS